jgi:soluble lytic murein transglycosylase-like protein
LARHTQAAGRTAVAVAPEPAAAQSRRGAHRVETDWAPLGTKVSAFVVAAGVLAGAAAAANAMVKQEPTQKDAGALDLAGSVDDAANNLVHAASAHNVQIANPAAEVGKLLQFDKRQAIQHFQQVGKHAADTVEQQKQEAVEKAARDAADAKKPAKQRQVEAWIREAITILQANGTAIDESSVDEIWTIIEKESGGNPNAVNNWDSNAAKGTPSKGLMQTIDPTFNAYKLAGYNDIFNPVDNIIAGVRYTYDRYGGFGNHPGLASISVGGGYKGY